MNTLGFRVSSAAQTIVVQEFGELQISMCEDGSFNSTIRNIRRRKGDTYRIIFTFIDSKSKNPIDISNWTGFNLSIYMVKFSNDSSTILSSLSGSLLTNGSDGKVSFTPIGNLPAGAWFYNARAFNSSGERITFIYGKYLIK